MNKNSVHLSEDAYIEVSFIFKIMPPLFLILIPRNMFYFQLLLKLRQPVAKKISDILPAEKPEQLSAKNWEEKNRNSNEKAVVWSLWDSTGMEPDELKSTGLFPA